MFRSLVRPERISSPITIMAAVMISVMACLAEIAEQYPPRHRAAMVHRLQSECPEQAGKTRGKKGDEEQGSQQDVPAEFVHEQMRRHDACRKNKLPVNADPQGTILAEGIAGKLGAHHVGKEDHRCRKHRYR